MLSSPPGSRLGVVLEVGEAGRDRHRALARPWQWPVDSWLGRGWGRDDVGGWGPGAAGSDNGNVR